MVSAHNARKKPTIFDPKADCLWSRGPLTLLSGQVGFAKVPLAFRLIQCVTISPHREDELTIQAERRPSSVLVGIRVEDLTATDTVKSICIMIMF